jgi:hypothetical protein
VQAIRLLVCITLVLVPAAGVLSALRSRDRRLTATAVVVLIASVAVAGFVLRGARTAPVTQPPVAAPVEPDAD